MTFLQTVRPEISKIMTMLRLFVLHDGTHALGIVLCISMIAKWTAREANKNAHIEEFLQRIKPASEPRKVDLASAPVRESPGVDMRSDQPYAKKSIYRGRFIHKKFARGMRRVTLSLGRNLSSLSRVY